MKKLASEQRPRDFQCKKKKTLAQCGQWGLADAVNPGVHI